MATSAMDFPTIPVGSTYIDPNIGCPSRRLIKWHIRLDVATRHLQVTHITILHDDATPLVVRDV